MENYEYIEEIGSGTYGTVYLASVRDAPSEVVAIKRFKDSDQLDAQVLKTATREVGLLRSLRHDNVVSLLDVFRHRGKLCLVFEFVEGTVLQLLEAAPGGLPEAQAKRVLWQVLRALEYLHSRGVVHRDVKPENLLVSGQGVVKLCDFGFARRLHDGAVAEGGAGGGGGGRYTDYVATRWYRAPELLQGARDYGTPVDVWAVGCLLVELLTGRPLFPGDSDIDQLRLILSCFGPLGAHAAPSLPLCPLRTRCSRLSPGALDFLEACLQPLAACRPSAAALLAHPYMAESPSWLPPQFVAAQEAARRELAARLSLLHKRRRLQLSTAAVLQLPEGKDVSAASASAAGGVRQVSVDTRAVGGAAWESGIGTRESSDASTRAAAAAAALARGGTAAAPPAAGSRQSSRRSSGVAPAVRPVTHHAGSPAHRPAGAPAPAGSAVRSPARAARAPPATSHGGASPLRAGSSGAGSTPPRHHAQAASPYLVRGAARPPPAAAARSQQASVSAHPPAKRSMRSREGDQPRSLPSAERRPADRPPATAHRPHTRLAAAPGSAAGSRAAAGAADRGKAGGGAAAAGAAPAAAPLSLRVQHADAASEFPATGLAAAMEAQLTATAAAAAQQTPTSPPRRRRGLLYRLLGARSAQGKEGEGVGAPPPAPPVTSQRR